MGFLERLRASKAASIEQWKTLDSTALLDQIDLNSKEKPVVIFKHSTTCGTSAGAKYRLETGWDDLSDDGDFY